MAENTKVLSEIRNLSNLMQRLSLANNLGMQFGGQRDLYEIFGYSKTLKFDDYLGKYTRQDIAARIIDAPALATWSSPPIVTSTKPEFDKTWKLLVRKHRIWNIFERVDRLAGLGQYALLVFGLSGSFKTSIDGNGSGASKELLYLQPLAQRGVTIAEFEERTSNARFGLPVKYTIDMDSAKSMGSSSRTSTQSSAVELHWSRALHVAENPLEDTVFGTPRLARVYNLLDDLLKIAGGTAETYWLSSRQGLQADIDKDLELDPTDAADLSDMLDDFQHQLRRIIRTRGVKVNSLGSEVPDPTGPFGVVVSLISGATGIPKRILLGSEAGQLASEQDRANWAERISERQTSFAEPVILEPFITQMISAGVLPDPGELDFEWPEAFKLSPLERAQTMAQSARAVVNISRQTQMKFPVITLSEGREILGLPPEVGVEGLPEIPEDEPKPEDRDADDIADDNADEELDDKDDKESDDESADTQN